MRIIAGKFKSRQIEFIKTANIRPTKDSIRENIFNIIDNDIIQGATVLDLFCGSGAYGFEALSRGASKVFFNDQLFQITNLVKTNALKLGCTKDIVVMNKTWEKAISSLENSQLTFNLIFIDPPYYKNYYDNVLIKISSLINSNSLIIVEATKNTEFNIPDFYEIIKEKKYQDQIIFFIRKRS